MLHCDPTTLALAALGEQLSAEDDAHLQSCPQCLMDTAELIEVVTLGREAPRELPEVPAAVWAGIQAELASELTLTNAPDGSDTNVRTLPTRPVAAPVEEAPAEHGTAPVVQMRSRRSGLFGIVGIAAAAGALVGGAVVWAAIQDGSSDGDGPGGNSVLVAQAVLDPLTTEVSGTGQAQVLDSPDGEVIRVDASALPPRDGFYEVWLIDTDVKGMIALGALPAGAIGTFTVPPGIDVSEYPIVDISLEPLDGDPVHSRNSLMRGTLDA